MAASSPGGSEHSFTCSSSCRSAFVFWTESLHSQPPGSVNDISRDTSWAELAEKSQMRRGFSSDTVVLKSPPSSPAIPVTCPLRTSLRGSGREASLRRSVRYSDSDNADSMSKFSSSIQSPMNTSGSQQGGNSNTDHENVSSEEFSRNRPGRLRPTVSRESLSQDQSGFSAPSRLSTFEHSQSSRCSSATLSPGGSGAYTSTCASRATSFDYSNASTKRMSPSQQSSGCNQPSNLGVVIPLNAAFSPPISCPTSRQERRTRPRSQARRLSGDLPHGQRPHRAPERSFEPPRVEHRSTRARSSGCCRIVGPRRKSSSTKKSADANEEEHDGRPPMEKVRREGRGRHIHDKMELISSKRFERSGSCNAAGNSAPWFSSMSNVSTYGQSSSSALSPYGTNSNLSRSCSRTFQESVIRRNPTINSNAVMWRMFTVQPFPTPLLNGTYAVYAFHPATQQAVALSMKCAVPKLSFKERLDASHRATLYLHQQLSEHPYLSHYLVTTAVTLPSPGMYASFKNFFQFAGYKPLTVSVCSDECVVAELRQQMDRLLAPLRESGCDMDSIGIDEIMELYLGFDRPDSRMIGRRRERRDHVGIVF
eukprot:GHVQ01037537.1.p1 GENE.GHVQ01037537.1~~GHVQ01037537.1.p1  ORF type:complete len:594 (+),score=60.76 GHVQ01037537.1:322-2103(+)